MQVILLCACIIHGEVYLYEVYTHVQVHNRVGIFLYYVIGMF